MPARLAEAAEPQRVADHGDRAGGHRVEALAAAAGMPVGNTSAQVRALHAAGLVTARRDGTRIYYRPASDDEAALYRALCEVARTHLPDAEAARAAYLGSDDPAEPVSRQELIRRAQAGDVVVIDVRPAEEYAAGHIPGAVSIPLGELPCRLDALPVGTEIVAYCRGAYCVLARDAVRLLHSHGRAARHLDHGMLEWRLDGMPVADWERWTGMELPEPGDYIQQGPSRRRGRARTLVPVDAA